MWHKFETKAFSFHTTFQDSAKEIILLVIAQSFSYRWIWINMKQFLLLVWYFYTDHNFVLVLFEDSKPVNFISVKFGLFMFLFPSLQTQTELMDDLHHVHRVGIWIEKISKHYFLKKNLNLKPFSFSNVMFLKEDACLNIFGSLTYTL